MKLDRFGGESCIVPLYFSHDPKLLNKLKLQLSRAFPASVFYIGEGGDHLWCESASNSEYDEVGVLQKTLSIVNHHFMAKGM